MKVVINSCFGGFRLSDAAYEKLIEWGIPVRKYIEQRQDPKTGLWEPEPANDGEIIFDRELTPEGENSINDFYYRAKRGAGRLFRNRYWESWTDRNRSHPLIVRVVEELGSEANGECAKLTVIEIPDGIEWHIDEYDGSEHIAENHRTWP